MFVSRPEGSGAVRVCSDLGLAVDHIFQSMSHTHGAGTPGFMAPEVLSRLKYNTKADVYSIGMISQHLFNEFDE